MKCSIEGCTGEYEDRIISHVFTREGKSVVVEGIPARVCDVCGDTVIQWSVAERLLHLLESGPEPVRFIPAYEFERLPA